MDSAAGGTVAVWPGALLIFVDIFLKGFPLEFRWELTGNYFFWGGWGGRSLKKIGNGCAVVCILI